VDGVDHLVELLLGNPTFYDHRARARRLTGRQERMDPARGGDDRRAREEQQCKTARQGRDPDLPPTNQGRKSHL
jgi:hypothetical protein